MSCVCVGVGEGRVHETACGSSGCGCKCGVEVGMKALAIYVHVGILCGFEYFVMVIMAADSDLLHIVIRKTDDAHIKNSFEKCVGGC